MEDVHIDGRHMITWITGMTHANPVYAILPIYGNKIAIRRTKQTNRSSPGLDIHLPSERIDTTIIGQIKLGLGIWNR
jgi:hypothetical protein